MRKIILAFLAALTLTSVLSARTYWYDIDYSKSQITFLAKSRVVNANGIFRKWTFKGKIGEKLHVVGDIVIDCSSIDTDNERRDKHLASADFFDCEKNTQHIFRIRSVKPDQANALKATKFEVTGDLTIHGTTQSVTLTLAREGGEEKFSLAGSVIIDREKFGIVYNSTLNPIEKEIRLDIKLQLNRRADKPPYGAS
jgi:polyisoprenoid-binding protein YceI